MFKRRVYHFRNKGNVRTLCGLHRGERYRRVLLPDEIEPRFITSKKICKRCMMVFRKKGWFRDEKY